MRKLIECVYISELGELEFETFDHKGEIQWRSEK